MGFISLPVSAFLYWLMLRRRREAPFPGGRQLFLLVVADVNVIVFAVLSMQVQIFRTLFSDYIP